MMGCLDFVWSGVGDWGMGEVLGGGSVSLGYMWSVCVEEMMLVSCR
jgi:hypothetical protein